MGKVPLQVLKELKHQARQNLCTINFAATFAKIVSVSSLLLRRLKSKIKKVARRSYENDCDYFEV